VEWLQARLALRQFLMLAIAAPQSERIKAGCHTVNNASKQIMLFAVLLHVSRVTATKIEAKRVPKLFP
jgi:hypothetical protein